MKGEDAIKVANCFYLKVPKLANLTNQNYVKSVCIRSYFGLHFPAFPALKSLLVCLTKKVMQQDQVKKTKINKKQTKHKQKKLRLKPKQLVKTNKRKKYFLKKESNVKNKN